MLRSSHCPATSDGFRTATPRLCPATVDDETAAIVLEPIQGEAGVVVPPQGYLTAARQIADRSGALLWFDEVQTGVGRTGRWFGFEEEAVRPDVVTRGEGARGRVPDRRLHRPRRSRLAAHPGPARDDLRWQPRRVRDGTRRPRRHRVRGTARAGGRAIGRELSEGLRSVDGVRAVRGRGLLLAAELPPGSAGRGGGCGARRRRDRQRPHSRRDEARPAADPRVVPHRRGDSRPRGRVGSGNDGWWRCR